jgi:NADP-dependent 3-hydroxy acid dehydrogenase YdfG/predicted RNA-binding protein with RPS1 domain
MREHLGEEYGGVVSAATSFGIFVTLDALYVEGLVHITELGGEYFKFDEARQELRGERTGIRYAIGTRVRVQVSRVDLDGRRIDFRLVREGEELELRAMRDKGAGVGGGPAAKRAGRKTAKGGRARPGTVAAGCSEEGRGQQATHRAQRPALTQHTRRQAWTRLQGRVAIVTGGGSGVGKAAALALLADGWRVAVAGRRKDALEATIAEAKCRRPRTAGRDGCHGRGVSPRVVRCHSGQVGTCRPAVQQRRHRRPWRAARRAAAGDLEAGGRHQFQRHVLRAAAGVPRDEGADAASGGRIINNGSISAHAPRPNSIAYTATKHAVTGLTKAASLDGRRHEIAVGQIDIGNALTELAARMGKGVPQANGEIAVEPLMDVAIVGQSVLYMANLPLEANVLFHTVMATKMPFVGRG